MEPFIGMISTFGFYFPPRGWSLCQGQLLPIAQNTALFSLLGTAYGGDGRTNFGLPELSGVVPLGQGRHPGSSHDWQMGMSLGTETHTMTLPEMPPHNHTATFTPTATGSLTATTDNGTSETPVGGYMLAKTIPGTAPADKPEKIYAPASTNTVELAGVGAGSGQVTVNDNGGGRPFNIMQPSLGVNYSIALLGVFPSRN